MSIIATAIRRSRLYPATAIEEAQASLLVKVSRLNAAPSKFDIDFKGCFKCGKVDHSRRDQCPIGYNASRQQLEVFYKELHIRKPHLARPNYGNQNYKCLTYI